MDPAYALEIGRLAVFTVLMTAGPLLLVSMSVGLFIAVFQAATQVHEMTLVFVPKICAVLLGLLIFGSFMLSNVMDFTEGIFALVARGPIP